MNTNAAYRLSYTAALTAAAVLTLNAGSLPSNNYPFNPSHFSYRACRPWENAYASFSLSENSPDYIGLKKFLDFTKSLINDSSDLNQKYIEIVDQRFWDLLA